MDGSRHARLVPRRLGRDDGGDDVPVGRADGRALLAHDAGAEPRPRRSSSPPAISCRGRASDCWPSWSRAPADASRATCSPGTAPAAGSQGRRSLVAAVYELTPLKDVCLGKCRSPLGFLLGSWRDGAAGALQMGARHGGWCIGCCWALMLSLFALGVMSVAWMAFVAGLIAFEKLIPWRRAATYGTAGVLLVLGVLLLAAPDAAPGAHDPGERPDVADERVPGMNPGTGSAAGARCDRTITVRGTAGAGTYLYVRARLARPAARRNRRGPLSRPGPRAWRRGDARKSQSQRRAGLPAPPPGRHASRKAVPPLARPSGPGPKARLPELPEHYADDPRQGVETYVARPTRATARPSASSGRTGCAPS